MINDGNKNLGKGRRGVAAVEASLVLPILILVTLCAIDMSQYISFSQSISNASREAARIASRANVLKRDDIDSALEQYFSEILPNINSAKIRELLVLEVRHGASNELIIDGDLSVINSGDPISIRVEFDYSQIRWLKMPEFWDGNSIDSTTISRRE